MKGVEAQGVVINVHRGDRCDVQIGQHLASCYVCGRMQKSRIHVVPGDSVTVELSIYDLSKGRITRRN